jgi:hypothetical protein
MYILLSEEEDNVQKQKFKLNSNQAAAESRHVTGHMLKVKRKVFIPSKAMPDFW